MTNPWQEIKSRLGSIQFLDLTGSDLVEAHRELGIQVKEQVWRILERRLVTVPQKRLAIKIRQAQGCWGSLKNHSKSLNLAGELRIAISDYINCLEAWSEGLELARFSHPTLYSLNTGGEPLSPHELALVLQHDNVGCQTGMYRSAAGGVQLWHTEEDADGKSGGRFDRLRIASFSTGVDGRLGRFYAFIYPDLMPGPSFGWRNDGYVQAVDSLLLYNPPRIDNGMLANVACWLALRSGTSENIPTMLESLRPFFDGYAMNLILPEDTIVRATRYELAGDRVIKSYLPPETDKFLFQVNYFSDRADVCLQKMESLTKHSDIVMKKRVERTIQALENYKSRANGTGLQMSHFYRLIASRAGGDWAYANKDVKAHFLCQVEPDKMEIWLGAGPARRADAPLKISQKI